jgi:DNA primase catalytic subunit
VSASARGFDIYIRSERVDKLESEVRRNVRRYCRPSRRELRSSCDSSDADFTPRKVDQSIGYPASS